MGQDRKLLVKFGSCRCPFSADRLRQIGDPPAARATATLRLVKLFSQQSVYSREAGSVPVFAFYNTAVVEENGMFTSTTRSTVSARAPENVLGRRVRSSDLGCANFPCWIATLYTKPHTSR